MTSQMWMILITVVYVCAMMLLSWIIGKKTTKDETEFMVGGREFTAFMTAIGNGSILISGGYLPSIIMYGYMFGMGGMWFYLGWGTGALVAWLCWAGFWRTSGALTPTEWFEYRYGKGGRMAITIVILFASLAILGWQYVGCGETIGGALGIDPKIAMLLVGVVVTAYVVFGGIWAATATDVIQFSWVFIIQFIILPTFLIAKYGLPDAVALPDAFLSLPFGTLPVIKFVAPSVITFLMMHQSLLNQSPYWARAAGTRSLKNCKRGWMWTVIIAYFTGVVGAFIGCYARQLLPGLTDSSQAFGALMNILPIPLAACIMAGLMAATMSTCDIYLVSGVNQLVRDVAQYFLKIRDTKKLLQWAKWGTIIYGMASVFFAIFWSGGLSYLFAFGTGVGAPLFVYYLDSWLLQVGNQKGAIASVAVSMAIVLYWDILTTNSQQMNSLWLIFPASFLTLVIVSFLTKKDTVVPVDEKTGPNEAQMEILKTIKRGYSNAGAIITSMTRFCNEHQLQAGHIHNALDSLEKSGYVKRKGQRLIAQLYFSLTEKGDAAACANMSETELKTIAVYGVDSQAIQFMHWIEKDDATMSEISGKHSIYMMELSAISEHLSDLGLVRVFGQGRLKAGLTDAGRQLLRKTAAQHS